MIRGPAWLFALVLSLLAATAGAADYRPDTGEDALDAQLLEINSLAQAAPADFVDEVVATLGAPRYLLRALLDVRKWQAGDVYYACALAYRLKRPCAEITREVELDRSESWASVTRRLGIRPGSAHFDALERLIAKSGASMKLRSDAVAPAAIAQPEDHASDEANGATEPASEPKSPPAPAKESERDPEPGVEPLPEPEPGSGRR